MKVVELARCQRAHLGRRQHEPLARGEAALREQLHARGRRATLWELAFRPAWRFVRERWDDLLGRIAPSNAIALAGGIRTLTDPDLVADVQAFFGEHDIPQNHLMLLQALERQRVFAALRQRAAPELAERFGG